MSDIKVWLGDDGVMRVEYPRHATVTLGDVQDEYKQRTDISKEKCPLLVILHGLAIFSEEAQTFLRGSEHSAITSAVAILVDPAAGYYEHSIVLIDSFQRSDALPYDLKVFEDKQSALLWLKDYL